MRTIITLNVNGNTYEVEWWDFGTSSERNQAIVYEVASNARVKLTTLSDDDPLWVLFDWITDTEE